MHLSEAKSSPTVTEVRERRILSLNFVDREKSFMKIDKITDLGGARHKIFLENGTTFILYKKEIENRKLTPGEELSVEDFAEIKENLLLKRAKKRGLYLLEKYSRSESNLTDKLREGGYPDDVVEQAVIYIKSFGYLDDENLARNIVESRRTQESSREIVTILKSKGIEQETINQTMEKYYNEEYEEEAIKYLMNKKRIELESITWNEKKKFFHYLARKGFSYDSIQRFMKV